VSRPFALPLAQSTNLLMLIPTKDQLPWMVKLTMIVRSKAVPLFYLRRGLTRTPGKLAPVDKTKGHVVAVPNCTKQRRLL